MHLLVSLPYRITQMHGHTLFKKVDYSHLAQNTQYPGMVSCKHANEISGSREFR